MDKNIETERIKKLIDTVYTSFEAIKKLKLETKDELSLLDKELSNQYHKIEGSDISYMCQSHLLILELKDILYHRREAKIKHTILESFVSGLDSNITKSKKRYTEILNKHEEILQEIIDRAK